MIYLWNIENKKNTNFVNFCWFFHEFMQSIVDVIFFSHFLWNFVLQNFLTGHYTLVLRRCWKQIARIFGALRNIPRDMQHWMQGVNGDATQLVLLANVCLQAPVWQGGLGPHFSQSLANSLEEDQFAGVGARSWMERFAKKSGVASRRPLFRAN